MARCRLQAPASLLFVGDLGTGLELGAAVTVGLRSAPALAGVKYCVSWRDTNATQPSRLWSGLHANATVRFEAFRMRAAATYVFEFWVFERGSDAVRAASLHYETRPARWATFNGDAPYTIAINGSASMSSPLVSFYTSFRDNGQAEFSGIVTLDTSTGFVVWYYNCAGGSSHRGAYSPAAECSVWDWAANHDLLLLNAWVPALAAADIENQPAGQAYRVAPEGTVRAQTARARCDTCATASSWCLGVFSYSGGASLGDSPWYGASARSVGWNVHGLSYLLRVFRRFFRNFHALFPRRRAPPSPHHF